LNVRLKKTIDTAIQAGPDHLSGIFDGRFFGCSKKQGVSVRLLLTTCVPTAACAAACYAHDVLDAAPASVVRGVMNGFIARTYEESGTSRRNHILARLERDTYSAIRASHKERDATKEVMKRRARVRFAHVGEISPFPMFARALAEQISRLSSGTVDCVVYTSLGEFDSDRLIINFTLDHSSEARRLWAPLGSRLVYFRMIKELRGRDPTRPEDIERHGRVSDAPFGESEDGQTSADALVRQRSSSFIAGSLRGTQQSVG
jgi:hypothetical protein